RNLSYFGTLDWLTKVNCGCPAQDFYSGLAGKRIFVQHTACSNDDPSGSRRHAKNWHQWFQTVYGAELCRATRWHDYVVWYFCEPRDCRIRVRYALERRAAGHEAHWHIRSDVDRTTGNGGWRCFHDTYRFSIDTRQNKRMADRRSEANLSERIPYRREITPGRQDSRAGGLYTSSRLPA